MTRIRYIILALAAFLILGADSGSSCQMPGNPKSSVTGAVYMDGAPITGTIMLVNEDGETVGMERTDMNGRYRITSVEAGTYEIVYLSYQGVEWSTDLMITVRLGRTEIVDLNLSSSDAPTNE